MTKSFSFALPGSIYEVSPDYGMVAQAWNLYSYGVPIVQQFFGIQPNAAEKTIIIQPQMPSTWDKASLENVSVGDNEISIYYEKSGKSLSLTIEQKKTDWKIVIALPKGKFQQVIVNGEKVKTTSDIKLDYVESKQRSIKLNATE
jgi:hypothetical protein